MMPDFMTSRLKYRPAVEKVLKEQLDNESPKLHHPDGSVSRMIICTRPIIETTDNMPFGLEVIYYGGIDESDSGLIIIYRPVEYMSGRKALFPEWILTRGCLDKRYKPKQANTDNYG